MEKSWIDVNTKSDMNASQLVGLAIQRVDEDSSAFHVFVEMLHDICGMDVIAKNLIDSLPH